MCQSEEQIARESILVQEMDKYIKANNLSPQDSIMIRVSRAAHIHGIQNNQDHESIKAFMKTINDTPSLPMMFKKKFWKTFTIATGVLAAAFMVFYTIISVTGYAELIKSIP